MVFKTTIQKLLLTPKKLFLVDATGALVSAFLLGVVFIEFQSAVGIPRNTLYLLAIFPCVFLVFDLFCYYRVHGQSLRNALKAIAITNMLYCALSIGAMIYHRHEITTLGSGYLVVEVAVVNMLALLQITAAGRE